MLKIIAILQIINLFIGNVGINVYVHYCNSTNTTIVAISKEKATCSDHICCNDHEEHHHFINCEKIYCCDENKTSNKLAIKDLECCQNAEKFLVLNEKILKSNNSEINSQELKTKIDFDIPFFVNFNLNRTCSILSDEFYKYHKKKVISPTIYFSSNLV